jgi:hypothetical protein
MPLRFANTSPPSGFVGDLHPQAVEHARHTTNRSAVGKTAISARGRPQPLAPPALTPLVACTSALRRAILRPGDAGGRLQSHPSLRGGLAYRPAYAPYPSIRSTLKQRPCQSRLRPPRLYPQGRRGLSSGRARRRPCGYNVLQKAQSTRGRHVRRFRVGLLTHRTSRNQANEAEPGHSVAVGERVGRERQVHDQEPEV